MGKDILNVTVVGAGYWGKNLVRNFATAKGANLKYVCDLNERQLAVEKKKFTFIETTTCIDEVLNDSDVDAVIIATDVPRHFEVAQKALQAGKHTFVEKPMTSKASDRYCFVSAGAVVTKNVPDYAMVMGVPAKRVRWISRHGVPLPEPDADGIMVCPESGYRYKEVEPGVVRCLDLDEEALLPP
jgi:hypothetical protein